LELGHSLAKLEVTINKKATTILDEADARCESECAKKVHELTQHIKKVAREN